MISIIPADRDVLRFLWFQDPTKLDSPILHFHFTHVVFGLRPSPAILGAVILHHLDKYNCEHPKLVEQIRAGLYVDPIEGDALTKWKSLIAEFGCVNQIRVPRCYFRGSLKPVSIELHGLSDASAQAYGAVVYLRAVYEDESISSTIVASKTRVAPMKVQTIPRLELLAALILIRLVDTLKKSLEFLPSLVTYYWTDSTVVLHWIRNQRPWRQYVSNQVNEIKCYSTPEEWNHCPGLLNPADMPSRGLTGSELGESKSWWNGPSFLCLHRSDWPNTCDIDGNVEAESELIKEAPLISHTFGISDVQATQYKLQNVIDCKRFSSLHKLLRTTAYIIRFVKGLLTKSNSHRPVTRQGRIPCSLPTVEEINEAEEYWIKAIQGESFAAEIKSLTTNKQVGIPVWIRQFGLLLEHGVLKCRGRLNNSTLALSNKNPILLPHSHPYVNLLILCYHEKLNHSGVNDTVTLLRETYWILKGKRTVKKSLKNCVTCLKCEGLPYCVSTTPDYLWSECLMTHLLHMLGLTSLVHFIFVHTIPPVRSKFISAYLLVPQLGQYTLN